MKKMFSVALVLAGAFLFAMPAAAQFTTVTATVQDPNGIPYGNGTMSAVLVPGAPGGFRLSGQPYSGRIGPITLDSTGKFSANFGDVTLITPSAQWQITVNSNQGGILPPLGTGAQTFVFTSSGTTISGSSPVDISASLNALAPKLTNITVGGSVTSVTGTSPIVATPNPITGSGSISCPTCIVTNPVTSCATTGGVAYENGTSNTLTCNANFVNTVVTANQNRLAINESETTFGAQPLITNSTLTDTSGTTSAATGLRTIATVAGNTVGGDSAIGVNASAIDGSSAGVMTAVIGGDFFATCTANTSQCFGVNIPAVQGVAGSTSAGLNIGNWGGSNFSIKTGTGKVQFGDNTSAVSYSTATNCTSSASPAVCGSAAAGTVVVAAAATTVVVNTTAITANSEIFIQYDSSLGTKLSVTCNTTVALPAVTARTPGTSFTITVPAAPVTNPACYSYHIVN